MRAIRFFLRLYFSLALPFSVVAAGARLLLSEAFLQIEYRRPGFPADAYGFTAEDRLAYGPYGINYLFNGEGIEYLAALRLPSDKCWNRHIEADSCALFGDRELRHMEDVKRAAAAVFGLALLCALIAFGAAFAGWRNTVTRRDIALGIRRGCRLTLWSIACLAVFALTAWDHAFEVFHQVFFTAGSWRFPFSDSLIRLYPEQLFIDAALAVLIFASLCAIAIPRLLARWD